MVADTSDDYVPWSSSSYQAAAARTPTGAFATWAVATIEAEEPPDAGGQLENHRQQHCTPWLGLLRLRKAGADYHSHSGWPGCTARSRQRHVAWCVQRLSHVRNVLGGPDCR
jgi:hypothetical protein